MDIVQRQMPPDVGDVSEVAEQLADDRFGLPAEGALEIAVLDQRHGSLDRTADVVPLGIDRRGEIDDRLRGPEQSPDPEPGRKPCGRPEDERGHERRAHSCAEDAEFRLFKFRSVEGQVGDQQRDGEADAGDRASTRERGPADRRPQPSPAQSRHEPGATEDADRLPDDVAEQDSERDRRRERAREEAAVDHDAGVHVARPGVIELGQPLVRRDRRPQPFPGRACQLRRRLLAEAPKQVARTFEVDPGCRGGVGEQSHRQSDHDRIDPGLVEGDPGSDAEDRADRSTRHVETGCEDDPREEQRRHQERCRRNTPRVHGRDHDQSDDIVDDSEGEHERAQTIGKPLPDQREHAERKRRVGRHRRPPPVRRAVTRVHREVNRDRDDDPAEAGRQRQCHPPPLSQLAHVELAPGLETDDEEEERHQSAVQPVAEVLRDARAADPDRHHRVPDPLVRRRVDVHPDEGGHRGRQQHRRTARLRAQEAAQRRLQIPCPGGSTGKGPRRLSLVPQLAADRLHPPKLLRQLGPTPTTEPFSSPSGRPLRRGARPKVPDGRGGDFPLRRHDEY